MSTVNPEFVERYQIEYEKNPRSRIFAPLGEAYRQMGLVDEALKICATGVQFHPDFAGGRVAFARALITKSERTKALIQLEKAVQISPDNLLAQTLLGETLLELRRPKDALKAFKMVLFINPNDDKALRAVRKWEFLSADDYDDELFKIQPVFAAKSAAIPTLLEPESDPHPQPISAGNTPWRLREIERAISLADAFTVRNDPEQALEVLKAARAELGENEELDRRLKLLFKKTQPMSSARDRKRIMLESLLRRINERRFY
jgi:tetratricopeptide (TPR) repeat protein